MKKKYVVIIIVTTLIGLIIFKLSANKKKLNEKNRPVKAVVISIPVKTAAAEIKSVDVSIKKTGELTPFKEVKAISTNSGNLQKVSFNLGDHVVLGQILAVTDNRSKLLDLEKAKSSAAKLSNDLRTYTELLYGQAATQEKVNEVRQNYSDAVNQVEQAKKSLNDAAIKAPAGGIIAVKNVEQGVAVNNGTEIATIVDISKAKVHVNLTEAEVYKIQPGQEAKITTNIFPGKLFKGTVSFISPQADQTHNYLVEIEIDNSGTSILRSGTFVYVDFSRTTHQQVLSIPREALTISEKSSSVFVIEKSVAHLRIIQTGAEMNNRIEVLGGLHPGDLVVTSGQVNLVDGSQVNISK